MRLYGRVLWLFSLPSIASLGDDDVGQKSMAAKDLRRAQLCSNASRPYQSASYQDRMLPSLRVCLPTCFWFIWLRKHEVYSRALTMRACICTARMPPCLFLVHVRVQEEVPVFTAPKEQTRRHSCNAEACSHPECSHMGLMRVLFALVSSRMILFTRFLALANEPDTSSHAYWWKSCVCLYCNNTVARFGNNVVAVGVAACCTVVHDTCGLDEHEKHHTDSVSLIFGFLWSLGFCDLWVSLIFWSL